MEFGLSRCSNYSPALAFALSDNPAIAHWARFDKFFDYITTTLLTTYRAYARGFAALLIEGVF
jgi:hypothetical protein